MRKDHQVGIQRMSAKLHSLFGDRAVQIDCCPLAVNGAIAIFLLAFPTSMERFARDVRISFLHAESANAPTEKIFSTGGSVDSTVEKGYHNAPIDGNGWIGCKGGPP
jgi:hypothetical protein